MGDDHVVAIGFGPGDPRAWVRAAYLVIAAMEACGPRDRLPTRAQICGELGISPGRVARAYRELAGLGLVREVRGLGYFPAVRQ